MTISTISDFIKAENIIASFATLIALGALLISWRSLIISKRAFVLAKLDREEKYFEIKPYLIEAIKWASQSNEPYVSFAISFANRASVTTSLTMIELEITWRDTKGVEASAYVKPDLEVFPFGRKNEFKLLVTPLNIPAKETKSGWLNYRLPNMRLEGTKIDLYRVVGTTINGSKVSVETHLIMTVSNEDL